MKKYLSRKFLMCILGMLVISIALFTKNITETVFSYAFVAVITVYVSGNVIKFRGDK